ncbi:hypothetical protein FJT64_004015 [Amphibalanus amphitrite]|uniref:Uncharacterized protein n=1 Tax=Amphibalanus amphitrite TaxID=1232801 RepID=A0A6A4VYA2_AMPAM|nr:hypothetical protein FJT64_004015 [Amphibalanus amphitrite]
MMVTVGERSRDLDRSTTCYFWPGPIHRAYYFTTDELTSLFTEAGFDVTSCEYVSRRTVNKKEGVDVVPHLCPGEVSEKGMAALRQSKADDVRIQLRSIPDKKVYESVFSRLRID